MSANKCTCPRLSGQRNGCPFAPPPSHTVQYCRRANGNPLPLPLPLPNIAICTMELAK
jgi:hypothetical protein